MKKQTAVEWLVANIDWQLLKNTSLHYEMIVNKAKEMEREQREEAYEKGKKYKKPIKGSKPIWLNSKPYK
jgi:hypothetical protein